MIAKNYLQLTLEKSKYQRFPITTSSKEFTYYSMCGDEDFFDIFFPDAESDRKYSVILTRNQHDSFSAYGSSDWFGTVNHSVGIPFVKRAHEMNSQSLARSKSLLIAMEKFLCKRYFK